MDEFPVLSRYSYKKGNVGKYIRHEILGHKEYGNRQTFVIQKKKKFGTIFKDEYFFNHNSYNEAVTQFLSLNPQ